MSVSYNGAKIIPAPFVEIQKEYIRTGDTHKVGSTFTLTVKGKLLYCGGSPNTLPLASTSSTDIAATFWTASGYPDTAFQNNIDSTVGQEDKRLMALLHKQESLRRLFSQDGKSFEIQPLDGSAPIKCNPKVININFAEGNWNQYIDYTIVLQSEDLLGYAAGEEDFAGNEDYFRDSDGNRLYLNDAQENWSLEFNDQPENDDDPYTFRLTHSVSAVGRRHYLTTGSLHDEAYLQAKKWVTTRLGIDNAFLHTTNLKLTVDYSGFNHVRTENTDELTGSYAVTEIWIISKTHTTETFSVSTKKTNENPLYQVSIEGTVQGMDTRNTAFAVTETKYEAALDKYTDLIAGDPVHTIYNRAVALSGITLNSGALSSSVTKNKTTGTINYSYEYDNRPTLCIVGAIFESFQITDQNPGDVFAVIPVIGRSSGPVLQDISTITERKRTLNVEVVVDVSTVCPNSVANVASIIADSPTAEVYTVVSAFDSHLRANWEQVFTESDQESWTPRTGRYNRTTVWVFQ